MNAKQLEKYRGIDQIVEATKKIKGYSNRVHLYINLDEEMVKAKPTNDDDWHLTDLIRPCSREEVIDTIVKMMNY